MRMKNFLIMMKKNRIKKDKEINKYKQEIKELKEKLNDKNDTSEIKIMMMMMRCLI